MAIRSEIAQIVIDELKLEDITPDTFDGSLNLIEELGVDSMELTTIAVKLQDKYSIKIDEEDYENLTTLDKIVDYIGQKVAWGIEWNENSVRT